MSFVNSGEENPYIDKRTVPLPDDTSAFLPTGRDKKADLPTDEIQKIPSLPHSKGKRDCTG